MAFLSSRKYSLSKHLENIKMCKLVEKVKKLVVLKRDSEEKTLGIDKMHTVQLKIGIDFDHFRCHNRVRSIAKKDE